jgi:hypothetical protein
MAGLSLLQVLMLISTEIIEKEGDNSIKNKE